MKTIIQQLPLDVNRSFVSSIFETPYFETPYHQHNEFELMTIRKGSGTAFIGDFIGEYQVGDVYFHGKNLPHWFRKENNDMIGASEVIQFREDVFGEEFFDLPEMASIRNLLDNSSRGIHCRGALRKSIEKQLLSIEQKSGFGRVTSLLNMLQEISLSKEFEYVSRLDTYNYSHNDKYLINLVFDYSLQNIRRKIYLEELAELTNKSVSSFSHYFKKTTKMGYAHFLIQIRISNACRLLKESDLSVSEICYTSGFNNWANFSQHFKNHIKMSPTKYRAKYSLKLNNDY